MASSRLSNENVLDFYRLHGERKYVKENIYVPFQPTSKSYEYSVSKVLKEVESMEREN